MMRDSRSADSVIALIAANLRALAGETGDDHGIRQDQHAMKPSFGSNDQAAYAT